eukprot:TRINITY_DN382_c0_g2_i2.p1 TRINITY_DN382_c0_g2~~TRINITY_DN382_c0_g2_i2.p1  ORF type:complete len:310 (-),score=56.99 TRINITY_DN382_c0_g2_i2:152-991(-)
MTAPSSDFWESLCPDWRNAYAYMDAHMEIPVIICVVYVVVIFGLQRVMKHRKAFDLTGPLVLWNALLAAFSMIGSYYVVPAIVKHVAEVGITGDMCEVVSEYQNPWVFYFCISKIPELIDTLFIVLRKKPLIFLHWYHHIVTLLYCWHAWSVRIENGGWFAGMNLVVHSIMYSYYAATAYGARFSNLVRLAITSLQISQMIAGLAIVVHNMNACLTNRLNTYSALIMYASYALLFLQLFVVSYITGEGRSARASTAKPAAAKLGTATAPVSDSDTKKTN